MNAIFKKLNFKNHDKILTINAPEDFKPHVVEISEETTVDLLIDPSQKYGFLLLFTPNGDDVEKYAKQAVEHSTEDAVLWFAYPKKSSKKYKSDISRDNGWGPLGNLGYEPVRQVAIDEDWSALRFKHVKNIKTMTRDKEMALSEAGKERVR